MSSFGDKSRKGLLAIFILSGFAGLIYQSIWSHYLGLFLGHAAYAQALVLAIFMGGMAAGAAWIAHVGQRWRNLIRGYALIEAIIGVLGLLFHWVFGQTVTFSYEVLIPALGAPWMVDVARWLIAGMLILPQTVLLGMTFPLMSGGLIRRFPDSQGRLLGGLYFTNSIGAAIGALSAVFVLLPWVGLPGAMVAAAVLNFAVAALAMWLARDPEPQRPALAANAVMPEQRLKHNPLLRVVLLSTALSGAASFAYEIIWIRMLSMAVGSTMHAFELMLASFIAGIALGGLWVRSHADRTESPLRLVGWMQILMGIAALASLAVYANAFSWVGWLIQALAKTDGGYALFNLGTASIAIAIMLPAAFFAGTTLPLFTVTLLRAGQGERAIGRVYAWNTLGSILGVFVAIHLLIPVLGLKLALCIAAMVDIGIGLFLLRGQANDRRTMLRFGFASGLSALALMMAVRVPFDPMTMASGVFRHGRVSLMADDQILYYRDGKTASVASVANSKDGTVHISTNGKPDASIQMKDAPPPTDDEPTMVMAAALPLTMLDAPKHVGVIGFGSGLTTHTLLGDPRVERVDTVEIESAMVDGARVFGPRVERAYTDQRSHIIIDDAKSYFSGQKNKYDVIISEPSNPWISGVGALFSKEFYDFVPRHLNDNGLFVQWVQLYEINDQLVASILAGLTHSFADYGAWLSNSSDLLIVASKNGPLPPLDARHILTSPQLKAELGRLQLTSTQRLEFRKIANADILQGLARHFAGLPVNSDFYPVLSLNAPKARYLNSAANGILTLPFYLPQLLETLGVRQPMPANVSPSPLDHFIADIYTLRARALVATMRNEPVADTDGRLNDKAILPALQVKALLTECSNPWSDQHKSSFSIRLQELADMTMAHLTPKELEGVFIRPDWMKCASIPSEFAPVFALLDANARRDYVAMEELGRNWLKQPPAIKALRTDFSPLALTSMLYSLAHQNRWNDLLQGVEQYAAGIKVNENQATGLGLLVAVAQNRKLEAKNTP